jgi:hypothetical protein
VAVWRNMYDGNRLSDSGGTIGILGWCKRTEQLQVYEDTGVAEMNGVMGSIYLGAPG